MFEITVPEFGESIQEVQVGQWLKEVGQWVEKDEDIVELESDKATQALAAPEAGVIKEIKVEEGGFAKVGDLLCVMDADASGAPAAAAARQVLRFGSCRLLNESWMNTKYRPTRSHRPVPEEGCRRKTC